MQCWLEIVNYVGPYAILGHKNTAWFVCVWQKTADRPAYLLSSPTLADIDRSRRGQEAVIGSSTGHVHMIDSITGRSLDGYPLSLTAAIHTQVGVCSIIIITIMTLLPSVHWHCWLGGRKGIRPVKKLELWGAGMVICLERGADLHMAQLMPLPLTVSCFRLVLPFWYQLTWVVPDEGPLNGCVCVCPNRVWIGIYGTFHPKAATKTDQHIELSEKYA